MKKQINSQAVDAVFFILPLVLGVVIFSFYPVIFSLVASFTDWSGVGKWNFIGLNNFIRLAQDENFILSVKNTFIYTFFSVPFAMAFGMIMAVILNQNMKLRNFYRTAFFIPSITSTVAIGLVFSIILVPNSGILNAVLSRFGIQGPDWLGSSKWAMPAVIVIQIWLSLGYDMTVYLGGLQGIPSSLYEAAVVDGASKTQQFFQITVPLLSPTTFFLSITKIISSFQVFNLIQVMTGGGPAGATTTYIHYLYLNAFSYFKMGYASAQAWILFVCLLIITLIQKRIERRWVYY